MLTKAAVCGQLDFSTTKSHTALKLLLHLLKIDKFSLYLPIMGGPLPLMIILLPGFHGLVALELLSSSIGTCCGADATSVVHYIG